MKRVVIIGCGFLGLNAAKTLGNKDGVEVVMIDRNNYHLFQPLLYQVATAGLSAAEIAAPVRSILSGYRNIRIYKAEVRSVAPDNRTVESDIGTHEYDYLILGCGAQTTYYGNEQWMEYAVGLKTVEQALEIRKKILTAFEMAEASNDVNEKARLLTFVIVGGGSTGVELAGAIGELSRFTLAKDFRNIDPKMARIILVEAGDRILPSFSEKLSSRAARDLESLGVQIWTLKKVNGIDENSVTVGNERIETSTVIWAAGIQAAGIDGLIDARVDRAGRIVVQPDLSIKGRPELFAGGDQAAFYEENGKALPPLAPVALQQGRFIARTILKDIRGAERTAFRYLDKGQLATIGRKKAVLEFGRLRAGGFPAWVLWLLIHIYYLIGFKNKLFVILQWTLSYMTYGKGARLIVNRK